MFSLYSQNPVESQAARRLLSHTNDIYKTPGVVIEEMDFASGAITLQDQFTAGLIASVNGERKYILVASKGSDTTAKEMKYLIGAAAGKSGEINAKPLILYGERQPSEAIARAAADKGVKIAHGDTKAMQAAIVSREVVGSVIGKKEFYPMVYRDLENHKDLIKKGVRIFKEGELKGTKDVRPLDGVMVRGKDVVPFEIKSPYELQMNGLPSGASLKNDYIAGVREAVKSKVDAGKVSIDVGKHEINMAQAEHRTQQFIEGKWGTKTPIDVAGKEVKVGYSVPVNHAADVEKALADKGVAAYEKIVGENSITYVYKLA
jgi:hypothetical protein